MARRARLFVAGAIYHVYCRTARGELVFSAETEAEAFIATVKTVRDTDRFKVLAWCLMGNHYHLVLRTGEVPLWRSMARLQGRVGREFNRRHGYLGRLWQSRYKARVVDYGRYYSQVLAYVHLNPVAAGLVGDPAGYPWSGHAALIGQRPARLVDVEEALGGYGETIPEARGAYLSSLREVAEERWLDIGVRHMPWWAPVTDDQMIAQPHDPAGPVGFDGEPLTPERPTIDVETLSMHFCWVRGVKLDDLASDGRSKSLIEARIALTAVAVQHFEHAVRAIARVLSKNPGTVSRWLGLARNRQRVDRAYRKELEATSDAIVQLHNVAK